MKKTWKFMLAAGLLLCLAGCGLQKDAASQVQAATLAGRAEPAETLAATDGSEVPGDTGTAAPGEAGEAAGSGGAVVVVYFSGTGNTRAVAELTAQVLDAPVYEIVPEELYTSADLNYRDDGCRANREMEDETARPAIAGDLSAVSGYKRLYIGYPVWWGTAPRIIQTFLESQDLSGVEIYTFCTSGGSGVEQSVRDLKELYPHLNIISGHRFTAGTSQDAVQEWLAGHE